MRKIARLLITTTCVIVAAPSQGAETVDYNQRLTSSGAVPEYPIPYVVPTTGHVKAVIDRVGNYVIGNTSLRVFDNKSGIEITKADLAHPNPNAVIDSRYTPFNRWDYVLVRGVNEGWVSPIYGPPAITGWNGLERRVLPGGRVEGICEGTTYASEHTYYAYRGAGADTIFVGPVLYAGAEVIRLLQNPNLQIALPKPDAVNSALLMKSKN